MSQSIDDLIRQSQSVQGLQTSQYVGPQSQMSDFLGGGGGSGSQSLALTPSEKLDYLAKKAQIQMAQNLNSGMQVQNQQVLKKKNKYATPKTSLAEFANRRFRRKGFM